MNLFTITIIVFSVGYLKRDDNIRSLILLNKNQKSYKKVEKEELLIDWTDEKAAPDAVIEMLSCRCKKKCEKNRCECLLNGLYCTDMCKCKSCENRMDDEEIEGGEDEWEDFEDDNDIDIENSE